MFTNDPNNSIFNALLPVVRLYVGNCRGEPAVPTYIPSCKELLANLPCVIFRHIFQRHLQAFPLSVAQVFFRRHYLKSVPCLLLRHMIFPHVFYFHYLSHLNHFTYFFLPPIFIMPVCLVRARTFFLLISQDLFVIVVVAHLHSLKVPLAPHHWSSVDYNPLLIRRLSNKGILCVDASNYFAIPCDPLICCILVAHCATAVTEECDSSPATLYNMLQSSKNGFACNLCHQM